MHIWGSFRGSFAPPSSLIHLPTQEGVCKTLVGEGKVVGRERFPAKVPIESTCAKTGSGAQEKHYEILRGTTGGGWCGERHLTEFYTFPPSSGL